MADARRWPRILPDTLAWGVFTLLITVVILMATTALIYLVISHNDVGVTAAASQAADQIITIKRMVERDRPEDRRMLIRRLSSPTMLMFITPMPLVTASDNNLSSRVVLHALEREFASGTDIRVDTRLDIANPPETGPFTAEPAPPEAAQEPGLQANDQIEIPSVPRGPSMGPGRGPERGPGSGTNTGPGGGPDRGQGSGPNTGPGGGPDSSPSTGPDGGRRPFPEISPEQRQQRLFRMMQANGPQIFPTQGSFRVSIKFAENTWFNARVLLNLGDTQSRRTPILAVSLFSLLIGLAALIGVTRAFRPLAVFTAAAERLGMDFNAAPLDESGPREVRRAAGAFNKMQERLQRFIQDRTQMLAAISHDLRTPITRLRLRAEFVDDEGQREKMLKDLEEMEAMIAATLAFSRDDAANEPVGTFDIAMLLATISSDARAAGSDVTYYGPASLNIMGRPMALKRAVTNFVDNAVKYGVRARLTLRQVADMIDITIDDDGPGIPENERERVFAPFIRLEASRSRETGGTGLGMTIARNIVRGMGGDVELLSRPDPGLRVRISLPTGKFSV